MSPISIYLTEEDLNPKKILSTVNYLHKLSQSMKAAEITPLFCFALLLKKNGWKGKTKNQIKSNQIKLLLSINYYSQNVSTFVVLLLFLQRFAVQKFCCLSWTVAKHTHTHTHIIQPLSLASIFAKEKCTVSVKSCPLGPELHLWFDASSPRVAAGIRKVMKFY
jgi:hypothetical protein